MTTDDDQFSGLTQEELDERVHEVCAAKAAQINNMGPGEQVAFLRADTAESSSRTFEQFREEWEEIPALVRASIGCAVMMAVSRLGHQAEENIRLHASRGLERRADISHRFREGFAAVETLFIELTRVADEEGQHDDE